MENKMEKPLILKDKHLNQEYKPIIVGLYDRNNLDKDTQYFLGDFKNTAEFVNFSCKPEDLKKNEMYGAGCDTYVMSSANENNKYSFAYFHCTGVIGVGVDKETGNNISFLSHQNPDSFLADKKVMESFKNDLNKNIDKLIERCISGSIDIVLFGGNKDTKIQYPGEDFRMGIDDIDDFMKKPFDEYSKSIKYLNYIIKQKIGFSPVVMSGPNDNFDTENHSLDIYFDNENRRLYLIKPKQEENHKNEAFEANNVEEQIKKFNK